MALNKRIPLQPRQLFDAEGNPTEIVSANGVYAEHHVICAAPVGGLDQGENDRFTNVVVRSWLNKDAKDNGLDHLFETTIRAEGLPNIARHRPAIEPGDDEDTQRGKDLVGFSTWAHVTVLADPKFAGATIIP